MEPKYKIGDEVYIIEDSRAVIAEITGIFLSQESYNNFYCLPTNAPHFKYTTTTTGNAGDCSWRTSGELYSSQKDLRTRIFE